MINREPFWIRHKASLYSPSVLVPSVILLSLVVGLEVLLHIDLLVMLTVLFVGGDVHDWSHRFHRWAVWLLLGSAGVGVSFVVIAAVLRSVGRKIGRAGEGRIHG